jgi:Predicted membrane protein
MGGFYMMIGLILLVIVAFYLFNSSNAGGSFSSNHQIQARNSLEVLNERYARGEINREEYLERKKEILK